MSIQPHGGKLTPRQVSSDQKSTLLQQYANAPSIEANEQILADLELFSVGALAPLTGFLKKDDYLRVVEQMRLDSGLVWSIPITLATDNNTAQKAKLAGAVKITYQNNVIALVQAEDIFTVDLATEAQHVYKTTDQAHPGVAVLYNQATTRLGGEVFVFELPAQPFSSYRLTPEQTRAEFAKRGMNTVVAFQTRNPIHRAHEYLTKVALEMVDGLLIHPLVGATKSDDVPADVRMQCYEMMMEKYYNPKRVMLSVFPASMRYAGPREAIFHALLRKNYGCSHFIVGRDHAGVGNYYGTYDAQTIFDQFTAEEIGIVPLKFEHSYYCKLTKQMASDKTSPSTRPEDRLILSGTKVREMLGRGEVPPEEFTRPEIAELLIAAYRKG